MTDMDPRMNAGTRMFDEQEGSGNDFDQDCTLIKVESHAAELGLTRTDGTSYDLSDRIELTWRIDGLDDKTWRTTINLKQDADGDFGVAAKTKGSIFLNGLAAQGVSMDTPATVYHYTEFSDLIGLRVHLRSQELCNPWRKGNIEAQRRKSETWDIEMVQSVREPVFDQDVRAFNNMAEVETGSPTPTF